MDGAKASGSAYWQYASSENFESTGSRLLSMGVGPGSPSRAAQSHPPGAPAELPCPLTEVAKVGPHYLLVTLGSKMHCLQEMHPTGKQGLPGMLGLKDVGVTLSLHSACQALDCSSEQRCHSLTVGSRSH